MHRATAAYLQNRALEPGDLLERYGHLVSRAGRRLAARVGIPNLADELWSAGALGLLDAAARFDPSLGYRFETFVEHRIRGAMLDELRRIDHLPRRLRGHVDVVRAADDRLASELGRPAEASEVAAATGLDADQVEELRALTAPLVPLDEVERLQIVPATAHDQVERRQLAERLTRAAAQLPERLQLVLSLHYVEGFTYREIAAALEVSEPRICQLHGEAVNRLRALLAEG